MEVNFIFPLRCIDKPVIMFILFLEHVLGEMIFSCLNTNHHARKIFFIFLS